MNYPVAPCDSAEDQVLAFGVRDIDYPIDANRREIWIDNGDVVPVRTLLERDERWYASTRTTPGNGHDRLRDQVRQLPELDAVLNLAAAKSRPLTPPPES